MAFYIKRSQLSTRNYSHLQLTSPNKSQQTIQSVSIEKLRWFLFGFMRIKLFELLNNARQFDANQRERALLF